jgi:hypothetical protein
MRIGLNFVTSEELLRSWKRTEDFLRDARSHFSEAAEGICARESPNYRMQSERRWPADFEINVNSRRPVMRGVRPWRVNAVS